MPSYFQNTSTRDRRHTGSERAAESTVRHETAVMAELTKDAIGYTVKWARVLLSNQLW